MPVSRRETRSKIRYRLFGTAKTFSKPAITRESLDFFSSRLCGILQAEDSTIVTQLLKTFPGGQAHQEEMLLLPGRLNNKKASLFSVKGYNVVSSVEFPDFPLHRKIDELREIILLIEVKKKCRLCCNRLKLIFLVPEHPGRCKILQGPPRAHPR